MKPVKKMNTLNVAMLCPWMVKCGVASYSYYLSHALAKQDCNVHVVRLHRFGNKDENYYRHYAGEIPYGKVDLIHLQHEYGLLNWLELEFYSAVKTHMETLNLKLPIVTTMHAAGNIRVDRVIAMHSNTVVVHNKQQLHAFNHPCKVIPMGVQKVKAASSADLAKRRWGVEGKTVGIFGFLSEYKGLEVLIRAMSKMDATLLVGGGWHLDAETPYIAGVRAYAEKVAPGRVRFLGYISEEDLPNFFGACDVVVFAHHIISESMALNTALAYGKAVLASDLPAFREKASVNVIMTFKGADDLASKINALLTEPDLKAALEQHARNYALANSWDVSATKHINLYRSLIK